MATPYLGEIRMVSFNFPPKGWALCNGQAIAVNQNQPLFALLGNSFGGDGKTNFLLPDFRGRTPVNAGNQLSTPVFNWGQVSGEETHTLVTQEMASHTHVAMGSSQGPTLTSPQNGWWASNIAQYSTAGSSVGMANNAIANAGSSQGHENRAPYMVINFIIALTGIFPTRS